MKDLSDIELLRAYARDRAEDAFRELVRRHIDLIYSAALRQLRNSHLAEEATQGAFIALAEKAGRLGPATVVVAWLYRAAHFAALNLQRSESRRKHWEEEAAAMNRSDQADHVFQELALPQIDGALAELSDTDRAALILRFLQQRPFRDVAQALGTSEEAAKKRVNRALEKLRTLLARRNVAIPTAALAAGLSQMPVSAAPAALSATLAAQIVSTAAAPTISIGGQILNFIVTAKTKLAITGSVALLALALFWHSRSISTMQASQSPARSTAPRIRLTSVMVDDQNKALTFYADILGFVKKWDLPTGEPGGARWLTVVCPEEPDGPELLLEPMGFAPARTYQKALFDAGIPLTALAATDVQAQFQRLKQLGVKFSMEPAAIGPTTIAMFEDTCGNRIQIFQVPSTTNAPASSTLKIKLNSVMVQDQDKALKFYTEALGFVKKRDLPAGPSRFLTVGSPDEIDGAELLLEPVNFPPARTFQEALRKAGIPLTQIAVPDLEAAYERMTRLGVKFHEKPTKMGPTVIALLDDTCGNLIQLLQN